MLLGPIKLVTMNASRSQDGFLPGSALQQPVAPVPGLITRASGCNEASRDASIELTALWNGDGAEYLIGKVSVHLVPASLQKRHFGKVVFPAQKRLLHRENIYGSGGAGAGAKRRGVASDPRLSGDQPADYHKNKTQCINLNE
jgi:hypothetical protein